MAKIRFILVTALALVVLSSPLLTEAGVKKTSSVEVQEINSTVVGMSTEVHLSASEESAYLELLIERPDGNDLIIDAIADTLGSATVVLSEYHLQDAGHYLVSARQIDKNENYSESQNFEVFAGNTSADQSEVQLSRNSMKIGETVEMLVSLSDDRKNPISGHVIKVNSSKKNLDIYSPEIATNAKGEIKFYLEGLDAGISELTVTDTSSNQILNTETKIAVLTDGKSTHKNLGGHTVILTEEAGPIDAFEITTEDSPEIGEAMSITLRAIDAAGITVTDYTGDVRFSSTDAEALLPNDYTFLADDIGEHEFSLAVTFSTPEDQILMVNDIDQFSISGQLDLVVGTGGADVSDDFVDPDYERTGDFTLISPASGSYSSESIDIQGEASYGYVAIAYLNDEEAARAEVDFDDTFGITIEEVEDGEYDLYVDIANLEEGDYETAEIDEVIETSDHESLVIDTEAPELISVELSPSGELETSATVEITVLSEANLEEVNMILEDQIIELTESRTSGKYEAEFTVPDEIGEYTIDIVLIDTLGNEVQFRDQTSINITSIGTETPDEELDEEPELIDGEVKKITGVTTSANENNIIVSWEAAESEKAIDHYKVYYGPSADSMFAYSETFDASTSWVIKDLQEEQLHYFSVTAIDVEDNEGPKSEAVIGIPLKKAGVISEVPTPDAPAIVDAGLPSSTPDTGASSVALMLISLLASGAYLSVRSKHGIYSTNI